MTTGLMILGLLLLLVLQGFFSGSEIAIVNCDRAKLRHRARQGDSGSQLALRLLERPEVVLSTTLVGTNIALVLLTSIATTEVIAAVGDRGDLYATLLLVPITLVLGEVVPKSVFQQEADRLTPLIIYPLYAFYWLFYPIVFVFSRVARLAAKLFGGGDPGAHIFPIRAQLRAVIDTAEGAATIDVFDRTRIRNVVRFGEFVAGDVMLPAAEMTAIDATIDLDSLVELVRLAGDRRVPVYEGQRSHIVGMITLSIWDLAEMRRSGRPLNEFIRPAFFVPAQQPLVELLPILRNRDDESAVVVDEYGSAIGLITVDMMLEAVVGQVDTGSGAEERNGGTRSEYEDCGEGVYVLDARMPVAEVNDLLDITLHLSEARTIGGLIIARLRHVPAVGESVSYGSYTFRVEDANERGILKVRAEPAV